MYIFFLKNCFILYNKNYFLTESENLCAELSIRKLFFQSETSVSSDIICSNLFFWTQNAFQLAIQYQFDCALAIQIPF